MAVVDGGSVTCGTDWVRARQRLCFCLNFILDVLWVVHFQIFLFKQSFYFSEPRLSVPAYLKKKLWYSGILDSEHLLQVLCKCKYADMPHTEHNRNELFWSILTNREYLMKLWKLQHLQSKFSLWWCFMLTLLLSEVNKLKRNNSTHSW